MDFVTGGRVCPMYINKQTFLTKNQCTGLHNLSYGVIFYTQQSRLLFIMINRDGFIEPIGTIKCKFN